MPRRRQRRVPFPPEPPGEGVSFDEARRRREVARAALAELALARAQDELITHARRWVGEQAARFRDVWLRAPDRHAPLGAARLGVPEDALRTWLTEFVEATLNEIADGR